MARKATAKKIETPIETVEEIHFRSDSAFLCLLVNHRTKFIRVIDFRAGALPAKRLFIQSVAKREGIKKVITLVEKDEVSSWTRVGFVREGTIPGFYKRSDGHLCGCVIGEKTASIEVGDGGLKVADKTIAAAKKVAREIPETIKGVSIHEVEEDEALEARDAAVAEDVAINTFDAFGRDAERFYLRLRPPPQQGQLPLRRVPGLLRPLAGRAPSYAHHGHRAPGADRRAPPDVRGAQGPRHHQRLRLRPQRRPGAGDRLSRGRLPQDRPPGPRHRGGRRAQGRDPLDPQARRIPAATTRIRASAPKCDGPLGRCEPWLHPIPSTRSSGEETFMRTREDIEAYFIRSGLPYEEVANDMWMAHDPDTQREHRGAPRGPVVRVPAEGHGDSTR